MKIVIRKLPFVCLSPYYWTGYEYNINNGRNDEKQIQDY